MDIGFYIGQTERSFRPRFNNYTTQKSTIAELLLKTKHNYKSLDKHIDI